MDPAIITTIIQLVFLEGILSIDNAAVLGAMVLVLPERTPIPWPATLKRLQTWSDRVLGPQRQAALKVGLLGAYAGRAAMLLLAGLIIEIPWVRILGAVYLLYLAIDHLGGLYSNSDAGHDNNWQGRGTNGGFWATVAATIFADLAFSIDNVIAAVALSHELWVVLLGVGIGMLIMRFAASIFSRAIRWEPALETGAYLLLLAIGSELLASELFSIHIDKPVQFAISAAILALTVVFARTRLRSALVVFRPILALFAAARWLIASSRDALLAPFRRKELPSSKPGN